MLACNNATDIELRHVQTYAVGVADIAAREGSPHNVLHSSSYYMHGAAPSRNTWPLQPSSTY